MPEIKLAGSFGKYVAKASAHFTLLSESRQCLAYVVICFETHTERSIPIMIYEQRFSLIKAFMDLKNLTNI